MTSYISRIQKPLSWSVHTKKRFKKTVSWDLFRKLAVLVPENVVYVRRAKTEKISIFKYPDARYHVDAWWEFIFETAGLQINKAKQFPFLVISGALLLFLCLFVRFCGFRTLSCPPALKRTYTRRVLQYNKNNDLLT